MHDSLFSPGYPHLTMKKMLQIRRQSSKGDTPQLDPARWMRWQGSKAHESTSKKTMWWQVNPDTLGNNLCLLMLYNIVIDMKDDTAMPSSDAEDWNYHSQVRQLAKEDAVRWGICRSFSRPASYPNQQRTMEWLHQAQGLKTRNKKRGQEQQRERDNASRKIIMWKKTPYSFMLGWWSRQEEN